jgi:hypothetical protein
MMVEDPRVKVKTIAKRMGYVGRGRSHSTITRHIQNMYRKKISRPPRLTLRPFKKWQNTAYFCKKKDKKGLYSTFLRLYEDEKIGYVILLSGCEYFIISREKDLDLKKYGLEVEEESLMYTPVYVMPEKWNNSMNEGLEAMARCEFERGLIKRDVGENLRWDDTDWEIYDRFGGNVRTEYTAVAREIGVYPNTVKSRFLKKVIPSCVMAHYFFPKGYDYYEQAFLRIHSKYEKDFVKILERFPCTSYVFPLEKGLIINLFHERAGVLLPVIEKVEEKAFIDDYLLHIPIASASLK